MKRLLLVLLAAGAVGAFAGIEWRVLNTPILQLKVEGETVELGLRDDGLVVWRKITNATNSPAECTVFMATNDVRRGDGWYWTNAVITNLTNLNVYQDDLIPKLR